MLIQQMKAAKKEPKARKPKVDPQLAAAQIIASDPVKYEGLMLTTARMRLEREEKERRKHDCE